MPIVPLNDHIRSLEIPTQSIVENVASTTHLRFCMGYRKRKGKDDTRDEKNDERKVIEAGIRKQGTTRLRT
jgi:hypothetical protein